MKYKAIITSLALLILSTCFIYAEEAPKEPAKAKKSLYHKLEEGGWIMIPLGICSVIMVYLIGDGVLRVTSAKKMLPLEEVETIKQYFRSGKYVDAFAYCQTRNSAFSNIMGSAISAFSEGKQTTEETIIAEMNKENSKISNFISYLSVLGVCTPMIGLLGTVTGMITAFEVLGSSGIGDPSGLSAAIGEVLVATAAGLFVAIPAFTAFYALRNRAAKVLHDIQDTIFTILRKLPYEQFENTYIGDKEIVAASPEW